MSRGKQRELGENQKERDGTVLNTFPFLREKEAWKEETKIKKKEGTACVGSKRTALLVLSFRETCFGRIGACSRRCRCTTSRGNPNTAEVVLFPFQCDATAARELGRCTAVASIGISRVLR